MKHSLNIFFAVLTAGFAGLLIFSTTGCHTDKQTGITITRIVTDERGLISVEFTDNTGDTTALDYINVKEFNQLLRGNIENVSANN